MAALACAYHRDRPSSLECTLCHLPLCRSCTKREDSPDRVVHRCPKCSVVLEDVSLAPPPELPRAQARPRRPDASAFADQIGDILRFPFRSSVLYTLVGLLILTSLLNWAVINNISGILGGLGAILVRGLEIAVYFHFVSQTAQGEEDVEAPDVSEIWEEVVGPLVRYLVALSPIIIGAVWLATSVGADVFELGRGGRPTGLANATGPLLLLLGGVVLLPLLTIIAAVSRSVAAILNPLLWVHVLRITGIGYVLGSLLFYGMFFAEVLLLIPLMVTSVAMPFSLLGIALTSAVSYLLMAYRARILGAICRPHMDELQGY